MDVRKLVLLIGALVVAGVTAFMAKNMFTGAAAPQAVAKPAVPAGPEVLVATRNLPVGTIINAEALRYQIWPQGLVQPAYYVRGQGGVNPQDLIGTVVRSDITAGQPITQAAVVRPGERGFLAAALSPGMRAVTVAVSNTSGVNGFVFPGDRVDIVLTHEVSGEGAPLRVSETIFRNVRVLATDRRINSRDANGNQVAQSTSTVTLETTPRMAERIAVAQTIGQLSLALRSLADNSSDLEQAIASGDVNVPEGTEEERRMLRTVANRPTDGATYTVGGDVSRFQRRSIPPRPGEQNKEAARQMQQMMRTMTDRLPGRGTGNGPADGAPTGPTVRVARGNNVTVVPVGAR